MDSGILFGLIAMVCFGFSTAFTLAPARKMGAIPTVFFRGIFMVLFLSGFLLFLPFTISMEFILITLGISVIGFIPFWSFLKALRAGKVGVVSPIANTSLVFTILFSILLFQESVTGYLLPVILIVIGVILISVNLKHIKKSQLFSFSSGIPFALITAVLWGLIFSLYKIPTLVIGPVLTALIVEVGILVLGGIGMGLQRSFTIPSRRNMLALLGATATGSVAVVSFNTGILSSDVSLVAALALTSPWIATLIGRAVYKEKLRPLQYMAILIILGGIALLSLG